MSALFESTDHSSHAIYRVLARKYRPQRFEDLIGQEAMVRTLSNALKTGRLPQAWMLTGVRGIGKTTTARIIARALNCLTLNPQQDAIIEPCCQCEACVAIAEDRHVDVQELDAASRTSVDDIREIIDGVKYGPVSARYKIYILDEVHMLSKNAFNALLKTLEEPPPHTKFIFATTEIRKVPVTVLSRCQRFDLRRIQTQHLAAHFGKIAGLEDAPADDEALRLIAHAADGSVRDGLSLLDQAIARGQGRITADDVKDMLGLADRGRSLLLCDHLLKGQTVDALDIFQSLVQAGTDPLQILQDLCDLVHLLTRGQIIPDLAHASDVSEAERSLLLARQDIKIPALSRAWQILLKGLQEVGSALNPVQTAEMVLIRLAYAAALPLPSELVRQFQETVPSGLPPRAVTPSLGDAVRGTSSGGGSSASYGAVAYEMSPHAAPAPAPSSAPRAQLAPSPHKIPVSFRDIVSLFAENREGGLYSQLYSLVHPVRCVEGLLEIRLDRGVAETLPNRVAQCLTLWTNQRWMVLLTDQQGELTLADQDKALEAERLKKAHAHPLTQAVLLHFPDATLRNVQAKRMSPAMVGESFDEDDEGFSHHDSFDDFD